MKWNIFAMMRDLMETNKEIEKLKGVIKYWKDLADVNLKAAKTMENEVHISRIAFLDAFKDREKGIKLWDEYFCKSTQ